MKNNLDKSIRNVALKIITTLKNEKVDPADTICALGLIMQGVIVLLNEERRGKKDLENAREMMNLLKSTVLNALAEEGWS